MKQYLIVFILKVIFDSSGIFGKKPEKSFTIIQITQIPLLDNNYCEHNGDIIKIVSLPPEIPYGSTLT